MAPFNRTHFLDLAHINPQGAAEFLRTAHTESHFTLPEGEGGPFGWPELLAHTQPEDDELSDAEEAYFASIKADYATIAAIADEILVYAYHLQRRVSQVLQATGNVSRPGMRQAQIEAELGLESAPSIPGFPLQAVYVYLDFASRFQHPESLVIGADHLARVFPTASESNIFYPNGTI
jgi:hypothetical protein